MDRWIDVEDHLLPRQPCPGCGVPHGQFHRDRCIKSHGELQRRLREALQVGDGFHRAVEALVSLNVGKIMARQGLSTETLADAVVEVLLEVLGPVRATGPDLEALLEQWSTHILTLPGSTPDLEIRRALRGLATASYEAGLQAAEDPVPAPELVAVSQ